MFHRHPTIMPRSACKTGYGSRVDARALLMAFADLPSAFAVTDYSDRCANLRAEKRRDVLLKPQLSLPIEHRPLSRHTPTERRRAPATSGVALMSSWIVPPVIIPLAIVAAILILEIYRVLS